MHAYKNNNRKYINLQPSFDNHKYNATANSLLLCTNQNAFPEITEAKCPSSIFPDDKINIPNA
jgi:hypothetical protein